VKTRKPTVKLLYHSEGYALSGHASGMKDFEMGALVGTLTSN
jgi:hypothetical protein